MLIDVDRRCLKHNVKRERTRGKGGVEGCESERWRDSFAKCLALGS